MILGKNKNLIKNSGHKLSEKTIDYRSKETTKHSHQ